MEKEEEGKGKELKQINDTYSTLAIIKEMFNP